MMLGAKDNLGHGMYSQAYKQQNKTIMALSLNHSVDQTLTYHEKSRLDNIIPQNEELINNLNLKIDRRINNGYYFQVATKRKTLPMPNRYKFQPKFKPKKVHPIIKKPKKINEKVEVVDQQQNTDEVDLTENWQNTSGVYALKQPDPIQEDEQMQFSCEVTEIQQKNQSMQWSIEPIPHHNEEVQYTLESQMVLIECRDASIQYSFEEPQPVPQVKVVYEDAQMQCQKTKNEQISIQYNEPLPDTQQKDLQINLPDLKQLGLISSIENRMKYLKHEQRKQLKLQRHKEKEIQILKLKEVMEKLEGKIELANQKQEYLKKRVESELMLKERQRKFKLQKQLLRQQIQSQYSAKLDHMLSKLKQGYKRPPPSNAHKEEEQRRLAQLQRQEKLSKEQLENYRKQVDELKAGLKNEMFKRMNYENESDDDTATEQGERLRPNSQIHSFRKGSQSDISMDSLFPNVRNRHAGSIIRNINNDQRKLNDHDESARISRAYWKSKSPFNYEYEQASTVRMNRKYSYLQKVQNKRLEKMEVQAINQNPQQTSMFPSTSRARLNLSLSMDMKPKMKYKANKLRLKWEQMKQLQKRLDVLFADEQLFRYFYSEQQKVKLGLKLFGIIGTEVSQRLRNSIKIYKHQKYYVFEHKKEKDSLFIVFYHNKSIVSGTTAQSNHSFYQSATNFKNGQIFEYVNQKELFSGFYSSGHREGYGILSNPEFHYQGDFSLGKKQGQGKLILENGDIYKGWFKDNHFEGEGLYTWANGQKYDGYFRQGLKHGWGRHHFKNGDSYEGQYKGNKRNGRGTYRWSEGTVYQGSFADDQKCGGGKMEYADGGSVIGEWRSDQLLEETAKISAKSRLREDLPLLSKLKPSK